VSYTIVGKNINWIQINYPYEMRGYGDGSNQGKGGRGGNKTISGSDGIGSIRKGRIIVQQLTPDC